MLTLTAEENISRDSKKSWQLTFGTHFGMCLSTKSSTGGGNIYPERRGKLATAPVISLIISLFK